MCLLAVIPVAVALAEPAAQESQESLCTRLVNEANEVSRLLRTISDHDSALAATAELRPRLEFMRQSIEGLERMPIESPEAARMLESTMRDLLHITQSNVLVLQRLAEVNAYGAEELLALFRFYKMDAGLSQPHSSRQETPLVRSYNEWCDSLEELVFLLRGLENAGEVEAVMPGIRAAVEKAAARSAQVESHLSGLAPQQVESERGAADRLHRLGSELRVEIQRLRGAGVFEQTELQAVLQQCSALICR